jgi:Uma2 family endonuclease
MCAIEYYTYDDYVQWEGKWELIDGMPVAMAPAPTIRHQSLASFLITQLTNQIESCEECLVLGEEDWKLSDDTVLKPDVVLVCNEPNEMYITKTPEIVVEVVSKSSAKKDEKHKFAIYEKEKVPYYILVYPDELKAKVYQNRDGKFDKQGDFFTETYRFKNTTCQPEVDFERVFKRFRKKS